MSIPEERQAVEALRPCLPWAPPTDEFRLFTGRCALRRRVVNLYRQHRAVSTCSCAADNTSETSSIEGSPCHSPGGKPPTAATCGLPPRPKS